MGLVNCIKRNYKHFVTITGPVIFEIINQVSGSWVDNTGDLSIGIGKFVTILFAITYMVHVCYFAYSDRKNKNSIKDRDSKILELEKICETYKENTKSLCNIFGYTAEKIKKQAIDYKKTQIIDTHYMNITNAATIVCERIYQNITGLVSETCEVTVSYYRKYSENSKAYTEMIALEGYNTNPKFYHRRKLLKIDSKSYFCERLLSGDNPDVVFLKDKNAVEKAFKINGDICKYNQYIGIPIQRIGSGEKVALIEVVVHNNSTIWNTNDQVRDFISRYCDPFKEYILLIDMLSILYETINKYSCISIRGDENGKSSEVLQGEQRK